MELFCFKVQIDGVLKDIIKGVISECYGGVFNWFVCFGVGIESLCDSVLDMC